MKEIQKFRYDPLYRVIDETEEMNYIEGNFKIIFDRLKKINNLGLIPEIFKMAKYSKYEHGLGTTYQINSLLDIVDENTIPDKYRRPLRLASLFLHTGHLPYTYSTERSLLLASNLGKRNKDNKIKKYILKRLKKVMDKMNYDDKMIKNISQNLFSLKEYKQLYKYLSAEILIDKWGNLKNRFNDLEDDDLKVIIKNLIDRENHGYKFLILADKADYVQRDALYFGTVRIDIFPKHLYSEISKYNPKLSLSEEKLIEANLNYLTERFYNDSEVVWFSRLYEKILASLIISDNFKLLWLEYNDDEFKRLIIDNFEKDNNKTNLPPNWIKRAKELFTGEISYSSIFELKGISFQKEKDAIDIEYELIKKNESERGLLTYPFDKGILIAVDYLEKKKHEYPVNPNYNVFSISVFQDDSKKSFLELMKIFKNLSYYLSIIHVENCRTNFGKELSWTKHVRFKNEAVIDAISEAILSIEENESNKGDFIEKFLKSISNISTFNDLWSNFENQYIWEGQLNNFLKKHRDQFEEEEIHKYFTEGLLLLPVQLLQFGSTKKYIDKIYFELLQIISSIDDNARKGDFFEALCLLDKIRTKRGSFQFFLNGMVVIDPEKSKNKQDDNEFDIIELIINDNGKVECWIYACSIADDYKSNNQVQITKLADHIHSVFPDLTICTRYVIPEDKNTNQWSLKIEDAGRNYSSL